LKRKFLVKLFTISFWIKSEYKTYVKDDTGLKAPLRFSGVLCGQTYKTDDSGIKAPLRNRWNL